MTEVKMPVPNFSSWHIEDHKSLLNPTTGKAGRGEMAFPESALAAI